MNEVRTAYIDERRKEIEDGARDGEIIIWDAR